MALAEERKVDPLARRAVIGRCLLATVTPYSVGHAVGANWFSGGANIISGHDYWPAGGGNVHLVIRRNWVITLPDGNTGLGIATHSLR